MKSYARIQDDTVVELFATDGDIATLFNAALVWVDVTDSQAVAEGWRYDGSGFAPSPPVPTPTPTVPSLADLQTQLRALAAQIAALTKA